MSDVMDAVTATLTAGGRTEAMFPYPAESVTFPCFVVGYPEKIDFDAVYGRGSDLLTLPLWQLVQRNDPKSTRDALSAVIAGAGSVKALLDGTLGGVVQTCRVTDCVPAFTDVGGVPCAAAKFTLEVLT